MFALSTMLLELVILWQTDILVKTSYYCMVKIKKKKLDTILSLYISTVEWRIQFQESHITRVSTRSCDSHEIVSSYCLKYRIYCRMSEFGVYIVYIECIENVRYQKKIDPLWCMWPSNVIKNILLAWNCYIYSQVYRNIFYASLIRCDRMIKT